MKTKKHAALALCTVLMLLLGVSACHGDMPSAAGVPDTDMTIAHTSWAHAYHNIGELEDHSDFIGLVEITGELRHEALLSDGRGPWTEGSDDIPHTVYSAKVLDGIVSDSDTIEIYMTGMAGKFMIADDPLMAAGEKWVIFARKNDDGTYTILGGPQGRFIYDEAADTITSLSYSEVSPSELEEFRIKLEELGIALKMTDLTLSEVRAEIAGLRRGE